MTRGEQLANTALNEVRALQREIQGLKNRITALESQQRPVLAVGEPLDLRGGDQPEFPRHVPGTTGRGIQYELSDGSTINAGRVKALAAEAALHG